MAQPDNTIDPNDLDSIDALLDEADFEPVAADKPVVEDDISLLEDTDFSEAVMNNNREPEEDDELERMLDNSFDRAPPAIRTESSYEEAPQRGFADQREDAEFDDFLARRSENTKNGNGLTVAEMDALKGMIIGFGSTLIVLALIAIGIATWGALGANSSVSPDTGLLEEIRGEAEISRVTSKSNETMLRDLGRKLDALSFQIEQVNGDLAALGNGKTPMSVSTADTVANGVNGVATSNNSTETAVVSTPVAMTVAPAPVAVTTTASAPAESVVTVKDSGRLEEKLDAVSRSLAVAQRRVVEINNRVKSLQEQYGSIVKTVKTVEKNILEQELKTKVDDVEAKAAVEETAKKPTSTVPDAYRYQAPDGMFYDAGNRNTFP